jgi:hypothetical protein
MPDKKKPPAQGGAGDFGNVQLAGVNSFDIATCPSEIQAHRAAWLARRFAVSATIAAALAPHCFGEAR